MQYPSWPSSPLSPHEQVRPLAQAADRPSSDDDLAVLHLKKIRRRRFIKCCGCITAAFLVPAIVIVVLIFTVFSVKDPIIRMNSVRIAQLELINGTVPKPGVNMTLIADVSVKNPNVASFKFTNTTTTLFYHGAVAGEAKGPPGRAKARRTMRMNVTIDIIPDRLTSNPNLATELGSGLLNLTSYSRIPGKVKIVFFNRHVIVKMNCSMSANISGLTIQAMKCRRKVDF